MEKQRVPLLSELTETERNLAMKQYEFSTPLLEQNKAEAISWEETAKQARFSEKTLRRWVKAFRHKGLVGLARQRRKDIGKKRSVSPEDETQDRGLFSRKWCSLYLVIENETG
jgi:transposase